MRFQLDLECGGQLVRWCMRSGCHTGLHGPMVVLRRDAISIRGEVVSLGGVSL